MKRLLYLSLAALMVLAVSCKKNPKAGTPSVKTLEANEIEPYSARLHAMIDFAGIDWDGVNYGFCWGTSGNALDTYIEGEGLDEENAYSSVLDGLAAGTQYWFKAYVDIDGKYYSGETVSFETTPVPNGAVDLGIVMTREDGTTYKLYWAACNLGEDGFVSSPEQYGDYYAWGELEPYYAKGHSQDIFCSDWRVIDGRTIGGYFWSSYKFATGPEYRNLTKYCPENKSDQWNGTGNPDNKVVLESGPDGDDVASHMFGGNWRMATDAEWAALKEQCVWTWTDNYNDTGVAGRIVTGNVDGYRNTSIFFPAAGLREGSLLENQGEFGYYWSSSLFTVDPKQARYTSFGENGVFGFSSERTDGKSVRPVYED